MDNQYFDSFIKNDLFKNTDIASLNLEQIKGQILHKGEGEIIFHEGEKSDFLYLIAAGQINIIKKKVLGKPKSLIFSKNHFFGNDEYFEETKRTSTAIALHDSILIVLSREEVENLILQDNEIYLVLRENLSDYQDAHGSHPHQEAPLPKEEMKISDEKKTIPSIPKADDAERIVINADKLRKKTMLDLEAKQYNKAVTEEIPPAEEKPEPEVKEETLLNELSESIPVFENDFSKLDYDIVDEPVNIDLSNTEEKSETESFYEAFAEEEKVTENTPEAVAEPESTEMPNTELLLEDTEEIKEDSFIPVEEKTESLAEKAENINQSSLLQQLEELTGEKVTDEFKQPTQTIMEPVDEAGEEMNTKEVGAIIKAMELVNSTVKIDDLLTGIVNVAAELTNADRGTLYLVDKEKDELWSKVLIGDELKEIRLKIGEGIAGNVAKTKLTENIPDVNKHPMFNREIDKSSGYVTKNMLCFPLKNKSEEVIGVLQLLNNKNGVFTQHDEELLAMISINAAIALQNADLVERLLTGERISSLGKMTNFLIQDIKKPVLVSKRYTEHLKSKNLSPEISQLVDMILTELTQVADLVQTTSSYAEGKTILLRTVINGLNEFLKASASKMEQFIASKKCKIVFELDKEVNVKLDTKEFYQCFQHIIKNACDAMPDGGEITIQTKVKGKNVSILFIDKGLGIADSFIDKIFEPFMTYGKKEGAGLGLSISKKVVEAHQGTITVKSSLGEGSTFTVTLPVVS